VPVVVIMVGAWTEASCIAGPSANKLPVQHGSIQWSWQEESATWWSAFSWNNPSSWTDI